MDVRSRKNKRSWGLIIGLAVVFMTGTAIAAVSPQSYRLGPNDIVKIQVYGEEDLAVESKIDGDGSINFPLLGLVQVAGKTVQELQEYLISRLASGYVRAPKVTAYVFKYRNFYVTGEVKTPGGYPYEEGLSVQKAITLAGGVTEKAERGDVRVVRYADGREETLPVGVDTQVLPDDVIVVAEARKFYISGEVKTPGRYSFEKGMTVNKALGFAGGRTEKAEKGIVKVTRITQGMAETLAISPEAVVLPDDILVVEASQHRFYASGEIKSPGAYPYQDGLTVHKAIAMAGGLTEKAERGDLLVLRSVNGQETTVAVKLTAVVLPDDIIVVAEGQRFYISGEVKTPGRYLYEKGLTVHKALSLAGGPTEKADKGSIRMTRITEGLAQTNAVNADTAVLPDDIIVVEPQNQKFYASGEVKIPGGYPYKEGLTVHKAIAMAGGLTEKAERGDLRIMRYSNGQEASVAVKLDGQVLPDDIIVVAEGQRIYVSGEIKAPGRYLYEEGLTVHKAITMAGGFTEKAAKGTITLNRMVGKTTQTIDANLDTLVLPSDFVVVQQIKKVYVNGEVRNAGDYPYEKGLTVHKVITMAGGFTDKAAKGRARVLRVVNGQETSIDIDLNGPVLPDDIVVVPRSFF